MSNEYRNEQDIKNNTNKKENITDIQVTDLDKIRIICYKSLRRNKGHLCDQRCPSS